MIDNNILAYCESKGFFYIDETNFRILAINPAQGLHRYVPFEGDEVIYAIGYYRFLF